MFLWILWDVTGLILLGSTICEKPEKGPDFSQILSQNTAKNVVILKKSGALIVLNPRGDLILFECCIKMQPGIGLFSEFLGTISGKTRFGIRFFSGFALPPE